MDGTDRVVLVKDDLGLPNGLTFDQDSQQLCWADAGEFNELNTRLRHRLLTGTNVTVVTRCAVNRLTRRQEPGRWSAWTPTAW